MVVINKKVTAKKKQKFKVVATQQRPVYLPTYWLFVATLVYFKRIPVICASKKNSFDYVWPREKKAGNKMLFSIQTACSNVQSRVGGVHTTLFFIAHKCRTNTLTPFIWLYKHTNKRKFIAARATSFISLRRCAVPKAKIQLENFFFIFFILVSFF